MNRPASQTQRPQLEMIRDERAGALRRFAHKTIQLNRFMDTTQPLPVLEFANMVGIDILFIAALTLIMLPLGIWRQAAFAVMKRNFVGYFSNPTGYVFLCLFVLLTSFAAFWPHEFFTTNLANFDQLNRFLPYIMLIFIPAITMSIWSEERRQGTDELLLTLPAQDFDIVIGKYFAAVMVFTVSLLFSQLSNYAVLIAMTGGDLDSGLLFATYLGYWFVGIAMLAIGMVASFLTNNLTVGFIFGVVFNAPLAFFSNADVIVSRSETVSLMYEWSLLQRFDPFGRGLISLPSVFYFLGIVVFGIYLSLVLIGRRHWLGGRDGTSLLGHFVLRTVFLSITVVAVVIIVQHSPLNRYRVDVSRAKISTLSPQTRQLLGTLESQTDGDNNALAPITVNAYVGSDIPTDFVQTKYDVVNLLREFDVMGGNRVRVNLETNVEPFSEAAISAERRFGIRPLQFISQSRGAMREQQVILGAAFASGRDRVVIPFFPYGTSVEYELIRSINTVAQAKRVKVGIARTDMFMTGEVITVGTQNVPLPKMGFVHELEKQYDVEDVDLGQPLSIWLDEESSQDKQLRFNVLIVVQPSKMTATEIENLIAAIEAGQPTLIFEDPVPAQDSLNQRIRGTPERRMIARGGTAEPGDISKLWNALGLFMSGRRAANGVFIPDLVWQNENPYPRDPSLDEPETLVITAELRTGEAQINEAHPATTGIKELALKYCTCFGVRPDSKYNLEPLVVAENAGKIPLDSWARTMRPEQQQARSRERGGVLAGTQMIIAGHIRSAEEFADMQPGDVNCVYVTDIDVFSDEMLTLRNSPVRRGIEYRFDNIAFCLNLVDTLAGIEDYIAIRNRRPNYVTLRHVESTIRQATEEVDAQLQEDEKEFQIRFTEARQNAENEVRSLQNEVEKMQKDQAEGKEVDAVVFEAKRKLLDQVVRGENDKLRRISEELQNERNEKIREIRLSAELKIQEIQRRYKLAAVLLPPIPPLLLGLIVFTRRRLREREGISKARRLK